jgi:two-component system nitrogen regulation response regulator NtrX
LSAEAQQLLMSHTWPGNVRELRNSIERLMIMTEEEVLTAQHVQQALPSFTPVARSANDEKHSAAAASAVFDDALSMREQLENFEQRLLRHYFDLAEGNVSEMARRLRTDRANLHRKLQRYGIK